MKKSAGNTPPSPRDNPGAFREETTGIVDSRYVHVVCPICQSKRLHYAFSAKNFRVVRCDDCGLMLLNPQPTEKELGEINMADSFLAGETARDYNRISEMKRAAARDRLATLANYRSQQKGVLLEIGCGCGEFLGEALALGYEITGVEYSPSIAENARQQLGDRATIYCGELANAQIKKGTIDVCVLDDVLEHMREPVALLSAIRELLKPDGILMIVTPSLDAWSAKLMRQNWKEFKPERLFYFDRNTLQHALFQTGYHHIVIRSAWKILSIDNIAHHFERFPVPVVSAMVSVLSFLTPRFIWEQKVKVVAGGMLMLARVATLPERRTLSIIVPAYNEESTLPVLMNSLLQKKFSGLEVEIVVVESNSTDSTRQIALQYKDQPRVHLILEDRPRGKGYAVRQGLLHASGDFILIQDADLEYDLEDYDVLLEPLLQGREAFVLGARHGANAWKMRSFSGQPGLSLGLNLGHWFFCTLINILLGLRLRDPFTMYKVFRRDCLFGLTFECDRFDFDFELVIKMVRKGFVPLEIPVNYRSRSFKEGKKVRIWRDPWTWVWAAFKSRFGKM
jgi:2-polyprenyl-3-methyl-5-hydroxy-6-metoxy-1,4-benzoquinol methylase